MNENSPICAIENPQRIADFSDWPARMVSTSAAIGRA